FQIIGHCFYEHSAQSAIDHTMVVTVRKEHLASDTYIFSLIGLDHGRHLSDGTEGQYTYLRLVDYGRAEHATEGSHIGHGIGSVLYFVWFQLVVPGPIGQVIDCFCHTDEVQLVRIFDHGHDKVSIGQGSSHSQIDVFLFDDLVTVQ